MARRELCPSDCQLGPLLRERLAFFADSSRLLVQLFASLVQIGEFAFCGCQALPFGLDVRPSVFKRRAAGGQCCRPGREFALLSLECPLGFLDLCTRAVDLRLLIGHVGLLSRRFLFLLDKRPTLDFHRLFGRFQFPPLLPQIGFGAGQLLPIRSDGRPLGLESALCDFDRLPQRGEPILFLRVGGQLGLEFLLLFCQRGHRRLMRIPLRNEVSPTGREVVLILRQSRLGCFQGRPLRVDLATCSGNLGALGVEGGAIRFDCFTICVDLGAVGVDCGALRFELVALRFDFRTLGLVLGTLGFQGVAIRIELAARAFDLVALRFELRVIGVNLLALRVGFGILQEQSGASGFELGALLLDARAVGLKFDFRGFECLAVGVDLLTIRVKFGPIGAKLGALGCKLAPLGLQCRSPAVDFGPFPLKLGALCRSPSREFIDVALASRQSLRVVRQPPRVRGLLGIFLLERGSIRVQRRPIAIECFAESREGALHVGESCLLGRALAAHGFDGRLLGLQVGPQRE